MKIKYTFLVIALMSVFFFSCSEPEEPADLLDPGKPIKEANLAKTVDVQITLPAGTVIDLAKSTLSTGLMTFPVDASGKSKAVLPDGVTRLAYLFDDGNNLILMGVINGENKEITAETTAQAIFYLGAGIFYYPTEIGNEFLNQSKKLPGFEGFSKKVTEGVTSDILYLQNLKYESDLTKLMSEYTKKSEVINIQSRKIEVDPNGFQSGIRVYEFDPQNIKILNRYRRMAQAFIYKTAYKTKGSKDETVIIRNFSPSQKADKTTEIESPKFLKNLLGNFDDLIDGRGIQTGEKETVPIQLAIAENEDEATYKVRVVGTSIDANSTGSLTEDELKVWKELMVKQFFYDFFEPVISETFSEVKKIQDGTFGLDVFQSFLAKAPEVASSIEKGDFKTAFENSLRSMVSDAAGKELQDNLIKKAVDKFKDNQDVAWVTADRDYLTAEAKSRYAKTLVTVENIMKKIPMDRLNRDMSMANQMDVFTAKSIRGDVKITPKNETTVIHQNVPMKASTDTKLSAGQKFLYKWSTTGKYGLMTATGGKKGVQIETDTPDANFRSEAKAGDLGENNYEKVKVELFTVQGNTQTLVGEATATINVKKLKLEMKPNGITLSGKQKQSVRLYLERSDNVNDIVSTSALEYKVEWSTEGKFGMFDGKNTIATTRGNAINYQALDGDIKEGVEEIKASIYFRVPGSGDWTLREEVKGKVNVNNDPKKIILNMPVTAKEYLFEVLPGAFSNGVHRLVIVPVHEDAKTYTVTTYGFTGAYRSSDENRTVSWANGGYPPSSYGWPLGDKRYYIYENSYYYTLGATWCSGICPDAIAEWLAGSLAFGGQANIIITLK